ncbi:microcystin degradation protein MlrC [Stella humosa]|uniref:Microcystinase C n=1 Tax=Stella humosa TaxID=94 RepID=A0A3N1L0Z4_9PROT|nr:M81 family metallopeptidase [Stella humosa]ROP84709.1 microcystin degradation protein MlrC [Stella humosa]BBK34229.1 microcystinase C [Stella humosa]
MSAPRIAVLGLHHEGNRWAPVVHRADLRITSGQALIDDARAPHPRVTGGAVGFVREMDATGPWTPLPIILADAGAAGPLDHALFLELKEEMRRGLEAAMPLDGVYFAEHGASISTGSHDPDGELYAVARAIVGPKVPIVTILDLHAMVSDEMVETTDYIAGYLTNPHVDQAERGQECARAMRDLLAGMKTAHAFIRLPIMAPQVTQLTASGPYADIIRYGQTKLDDTVLNVSILGGFTYGDTPYNGMAFIVTTRGDEARAKELCAELAARTWADRHRFVPRLTALEDCVQGALARAADPSLPAAIIADVADNPGGGGRGNTVWLLKALYSAKAEGVILGHLFDAPLAAEAHRLGVGARFDAHFNRDEEDERSEPFSAQATVVGLSDGVFVGQEGGSRAGMTVDLGPSAVLRVGTLTVAVISRRQQTIDPGYFENLGVSVTEARTVVVKSRGHFRAGFLKYFQPAQVIEADVPGLTSPNLDNFEFRNVVRPLFPLDQDFDWSPPAR